MKYAIVTYIYYEDKGHVPLIHYPKIQCVIHQVVFKI